MAGRATEHQLRAEDDLLRGVVGLADSLQHQPHHLATHRLDGLSHGRERGPRLARGGQIVEADDGDVVRHAPPGVLDGLHGREGHAVRGHEDGVEIRASVEQRVRGLDRGPGAVLAVHLQGGVEVTPGGAQRVVIALQAIQGGGEVQGAVDGGDDPSPALEQVTHRRLCPGPVLRIDVGHETLVHGPSAHHEGNVVACHSPQEGIGSVGAHEHHSVDVTGGEIAVDRWPPPRGSGPASA